MAVRIAYRKMLNIPDEFTDAQADFVIATFRKGVDQGRKEGVSEGRESLAAEFKSLLNIE